MMLRGVWRASCESLVKRVLSVQLNLDIPASRAGQAGLGGEIAANADKQ